MEFELIDESEIEYSRRPASKKLPEWVPVLSWMNPDLTDTAMKARGLLACKEDMDQVSAMREANRIASERQADADRDQYLARKKLVLQHRNAKEVRIHL